MFGAGNPAQAFAGDEMTKGHQVGFVDAHVILGTTAHHSVSNSKAAYGA